MWYNKDNMIQGSDVSLKRDRRCFGYRGGQMKKILAPVALFIGSAAVIFGLSLLNLVLFVNILDFVILVEIAEVVGLGFAQAALQRVFERKTGLSWVRFMLWAYLPSAAVSAVYFIVVLILGEVGYFKGFLGGIVETLMGLAWLITSIAALIAGLIVYVAQTYAREEKG